MWHAVLAVTLARSSGIREERRKSKREYFICKVPNVLEKCQMFLKEFWVYCNVKFQMFLKRFTKKSEGNAEKSRLLEIEVLIFFIRKNTKKLKSFQKQL